MNEIPHDVPSEKNGFTLIELLVVVALIAIMLVFVVPAATTMLGGTNLNKATQTVVDHLTLARQTAIGLNRTVEVRFYRYKDSETPGSGNCYRAMQTWEVVKANNIVPLEKVQTLPTGIIMDAGSSDDASTLSSLFSRSNRAVVVGQLALPRVAAQNYSYSALRFTPSGGTDLTPTGAGAARTWFLTIHSELKGDGLSAPPPNFVTIQVDPVNGTLDFFRPGVSSS